MHLDTHRIRVALGLAAKAAGALFLAVGLLPAANAQLGSAKDSSGKPICLYSGFTLDAATNTLTLNCIDVPPPGAFAWTSPTATAEVGGGYTILKVSRTANLAHAYDVGYTVTGGTGNWWFNGAQTGGVIPFGPNVASVELAFYPGSVPSSATITLTTATAKTTGAPAMSASGSVAVTIRDPICTGPSCGITKRGCSTSATKGNAFTVTGQKFEVTLAPGETAAFEFQPRNDDTQFSTTETINTPDTADHLVTISRCPGDFTPVWPCAYAANFKGGNQSSAINPGAFWKCPVTTSEKWYMNVKQVKHNDFNANSCTLTSGCEMRVQIQGY